MLRTALALAALTQRSVRIEKIRAGRRKPGLQPQHLTAVRALARLCDAEVEGDRLDSQSLHFVPRSAPRAGRYAFDVAQMTKGGSAGSVALIFQAILLPLALAGEPSHLTLVGGTHVAWSPPFDYLKRVYLPTLARMGVQAKIHLEKWGWYPIGGGQVKATVQGVGKPHAARGKGQQAKGEEQAATEGRTGLTGLDLRERGELLRVRGLSASSNLPKHIRERQEGTVLQILRSAGIQPRVDVMEGDAKGQGTVVFLWAEFENALAGFCSLGARGKPAEQVAEEAARALLAFLHTGAALDRHLADQLVLPMALADSPSILTTETVTPHLTTVAWVVNQFFPGKVAVEGQEGRPGVCRVG